MRKRTPAGEQQYEWDEFNRLLSVRVAETSRQSEARYFYDAFGRRIAKEVNGERTVFGWDGDTLAYESDGVRGTHYLYEPRTFVPLAQYVAEPVEGIATPQWKSTDRYVPEEDPLQKMPERRGDAAVFYYHCDQIGTPQLLTDDDGDVVWEASYKAWGEAREVIARASKATGIVAKNALRFQGQWGDDETGLHYNRYRYYDPHSGRFVSKDPIGLQGGPNIYQYAPNPILWTDALGLARELSGCDSSNRPLSSSQYSVLHEVQLAPGQEVGSDPSHFREANRQFDAAMQSDPQFKQMMDQHYSGVSDHVAAGPRGGYKSSAPPGFSWHHHPCRKGVLQLVPMSQHQAPGPVQAVLHPGGQGGKQNWGGGRAR